MPEVSDAPLQSGRTLEAVRLTLILLRDYIDAQAAEIPWRHDTVIPAAAAFPFVLVRGSYTECAIAVAAHLKVNKPLIITDEACFDFAGKEQAAALPRAETHIFPGGVKPAETNARLMAERARACQAEAVFAVGTGTLGDIGKRAAYLAGLPYAVFPTGLSMNGFCSANASLYEEDGVKRSLKGQAPLAAGVAADALPKAPLRLLRAGIGDALCRPLCRFDMLAAHHWTGAPYDEAPFDLMRAEEDVLTESLPALLAGDHAAVLRFLMVLFLGGGAMNLAGSSAPASQAEHLLAHERDSRLPFGLEFHGESVARCLPYVAALQYALTCGRTAAGFNVARYRRALMIQRRRAERRQDPLYSATAFIYKMGVKLPNRSGHTFEGLMEALGKRERDLIRHTPAMARLACLPPEARGLSYEALPLRRDRFTCADLASGLNGGKLTHFMKKI